MDIKSLPVLGNKELDIVNKMAILRNGNIPVNTVILTGPKEDVTYVLEEEKKLLGTMFRLLGSGEQPVDNKVNFTQNAGGITTRAQTIDVSGLGFACLEEFVSLLAFDDLTHEKLKPLGHEVTSVIRKHMNDVATSVIYAHYEKFDDNRFRSEDFDEIKAVCSKIVEESPYWENASKQKKDISSMLKASLKTEHISKDKVTEPQKQTVTGSFDSVESFVDPTVSKNEKDLSKDGDLGIFEKEEKNTRRNRLSEIINAKKKGNASQNSNKEKPKKAISQTRPQAEEISMKDNEHFNASRLADIKSVKKEAEIHEISLETKKAEDMIPDPNDISVDEADLETENGEFIPKPTVIEKKKQEYIVKEELTPEEEAANEKLLSDIRQLYEATIRFAEETCNSRYRIMINKMQDSVKTNIFKTQFCPMYLETSDDTSTELYKRLYDLDRATAAFQKNVVHQIYKIGCYQCNHNWIEDITFLEKKPHIIRCPECGAEYPFEKT